MSGALDVMLSAEDLAAIVDRLGATEGMAAYALREAANHAARLAARRSRQPMSRGLEVSAATLRRRLKMSTARGLRRSGAVRYSSAQADQQLRARATVWFGFNPVDPFDLKAPVQWSSDPRTRSSGVSAGRYRWDGAFVAHRRKGASKEKGGLAVFMRKGRRRLPIIRQFADINAKGLEIISSAVFPGVAEEFYQRFEQVLNKEIERGRFIA